MTFKEVCEKCKDGDFIYRESKPFIKFYNRWYTDFDEIVPFLERQQNDWCIGQKEDK
jgi:hypothetical protein